MEQTYLIIFFGIIIVNFAIGQVLDYINNQNRPALLPKELEDFYDQEKYTKSLAYKKEHNRIGNISGWASFIAILSFLLTGAFGSINEWLESFGLQDRWLRLAFFGILFFASDILSIPLSLYSTFVIEEKYGFNKTTPKTFVIDKLKSYLITILLGGGLVFLLLSIIIGMGSNFWLWAWLLMVGIMLFMNFLRMKMIL